MSFTETKNIQDALVSIIIPAFNGEKYIAETVMSCLSQTYENIEIIVIDDSSSDDTCSVVSNIAANNDNIHLIVNDENCGIMANFNKGSDLSKGEYLLFLGHDDKLPPHHIETILNDFTVETAFVHCNSIVIDERGNEIKLAKKDRKQIKKTSRPIYYLSKSNFVNICGCIISKKHYDLIGGSEVKYRNYGEWINWIKLASCGKVKYNVQSRSYRRKHASNFSKTLMRKEIRPEFFKYKTECRNLAYFSGSFSPVQAFAFHLKMFSQHLKYRINLLRG